MSNYPAGVSNSDFDFDEPVCACDDCGESYLVVRGTCNDCGSSNMVSI